MERTLSGMNLNQITLPAAGMGRSVTFYSRLGYKQIVESTEYARFECPAGETRILVVEQVGST